MVYEALLVAEQARYEERPAPRRWRRRQMKSITTHPPRRTGLMRVTGSPVAERDARLARRQQLARAA